jgi:hypothetical protein
LKRRRAARKLSLRLRADQATLVFRRGATWSSPVPSACPAVRGLAALLAAALVLPANPALAQHAPSDVADLVGARGSGGETELGNRGYVNVHAAQTSVASYTYWWSANRKQCVRVKTSDGRYEQLAKVSNSDCNQKDPDSGPSTGAKVAIGAAALLGVAALVHKSHHRDDKNHDERQTADFERGYRDGLYNHAYHNHGNAREYSDGFSAGVEDRRGQSSYRSGSEYRGGYQAHVSVSDLDSRDTGYAFSQLERRGFKLAGERKRSGDKYQWFYWNASTRQCMDVHTEGQRVRSIREVSDNACT